MTTMNSSLSESLDDFVHDQVSSRGYSTSGEYIRDLIRKEQDRQRLRSLLLEGVGSPQADMAHGDYFHRCRPPALSS